MKISFTGTQQGMVPFQKNELRERLEEFSCSELINGGCLGADSESWEIAADCGVRIFHIYPSYLRTKQGIWVSFGYSNDEYIEYKSKEGIFSIKIEKEAPPLERNKKIVDESDMLIAAPKEHQLTMRSGTWATIRYAWKRKKKVIIIPPIVRD